MQNLVLQRRMLTTTGLIIAAVLFFAVNILSSGALQKARFDLTAGNLYTLSEGTRNILTNIQEPITLRLYVSKKLATNMPGINSYTQRVEELLKEFGRHAGDKLKLSIIDPEPFSEEEDRAVSYGLQGVPVDEGSTTFYFGLVGTNAVDNQESIPFFEPSRGEYLEYDLAKLVSTLSTAKKAVVGILSTIPLTSAPANPLMQQAGSEQLMIVDQLEQQFQVRTLDTTIDRIPEDVSVLMLVHPKDLSDTTLYAIDQFVLRGGRAMVFVDPHAESVPDNNAMMGMQSTSNASNPSKLFDAWGISMLPNVTAGDMDAARKVQFNAGARPVVIDYPVWLDLTEANIAKNDIVTGQLTHVTLASAGILERVKDAPTEFVPLLQTGPQAAKIDTGRIGMFADPQELVRGFRPEGQFTLAARVTGKIKSAFPDGAPAKTEPPPDEQKPKADESPLPAHLTESKESINVMVIADTDLLQDRFWVQVRALFGQRIAVPESGNGSLIMSAIDNLLGSNDLISVRNRGGFARPFTRLKDLQQEAEQRFLEKQQQLRDQLRDTEMKLAELQRDKRGDSALILSAEQEQEVARFRSEKVKIRKELRDVQHELNKNIERMEAWMKFLNIGVTPILVGLTGVLVGIYRARRRRSAQTSRKLIQGAAA